MGLNSFVGRAALEELEPARLLPIAVVYAAFLACSKTGCRDEGLRDLCVLSRPWRRVVDLGGCQNGKGSALRDHGRVETGGRRSPRELRADIALESCAVYRELRPQSATQRCRFGHFSHNGPPDAILGDAYMVNSAGTPPLPVKFEALASR